MRRLRGCLQLGRQLCQAGLDKQPNRARQCHGHALKATFLKLLKCHPLFVQVLGKETEESAAFELDLTSLRQVKHWHLNLVQVGRSQIGFGHASLIWHHQTDGPQVVYSRKWPITTCPCLHIILWKFLLEVEEVEQNFRTFLPRPIFTFLFFEIPLLLKYLQHSS